MNYSHERGKYENYDVCSNGILLSPMKLTKFLRNNTKTCICNIKSAILEGTLSQEILEQIILKLTFNKKKYPTVTIKEQTIGLPVIMGDVFGDKIMGYSLSNEGLVIKRLDDSKPYYGVDNLEWIPKHKLLGEDRGDNSTHIINGYMIDTLELQALQSIYQSAQKNPNLDPLKEAVEKSGLGDTLFNSGIDRKNHKDQLVKFITHKL